MFTKITLLGSKNTEKFICRSGSHFCTKQYILALLVFGLCVAWLVMKILSDIQLPTAAEDINHGKKNKRKYCINRAHAFHI